MKRIVFITILLAMLAPFTATAEYMSVKVTVANIRSGPGESNELLWKVEAYHPLYILEKKGAWYRFRDFEGDEGWIYSSLVSEDEGVITIKDNCNIRSGPGTNNDIVFTAELGIPFKVLKRKGKWLNILHTDGDRGWIHQSLVWPPQ